MGKILTWLLPKETRFFRMFEHQSANVVVGSGLFKELIDGYSTFSDTRRQSIVTRIKEIEGKGDLITHAIISEINKSFITPFDREDIYNLTVILDDVIDLINAAAIRLILFKVKKIPPEMKDLFEYCSRSVVVVHNIVKHLGQLKNIQKIFIDIHNYENKADETYHDALANLLNDNTKMDARNIIKYKEIYDILEKIVDKCEAFTHICEGIGVKNG